MPNDPVSFRNSDTLIIKRGHQKRKSTYHLSAFSYNIPLDDILPEPPMPSRDLDVLIIRKPLNAFRRPNYRLTPFFSSSSYEIIDYTPLELQKRIIPSDSIVYGYRRAPNSCYWFRNTIPPPEPPPIPARSLDVLIIHRPLNAFRRPKYFLSPFFSSSSYEIIQPVPIELPKILSPSNTRADGYRRTANTAYWFSNLLSTPEILSSDEHEYRRAITERAPGYKRTANFAYRISNLLSTEEHLPDERPRGYITDFAYSYRRTSNSAYRITILQSTEEELTNDRARGYVTDFAPGYRRTSNTAYWYTNLLAFEEVKTSTYKLEELPSVAYGYRRASNTAYWKDNLLSTPESLPSERPRGYITDFAYGYRRTSNISYWFTNLLSTPEHLPEDRPRAYITDFAYGYRRAGNSAYWYTNLLSAEEELPNDRSRGSQYFTEKVYAYRRAINTAYDFINLLPTPEKIQDSIEITALLSCEIKPKVSDLGNFFVYL